MGTLVIIVAAILAIAGIAMSLWSTKERTKRVAFAVLSVLVILLGILQFFQNRATELSIMGDPRHPPYLDIFFLNSHESPAGYLVNPSDYPAYAVVASIDYMNVPESRPQPAGTEPKEIAPKSSVYAVRISWLASPPPQILQGPHNYSIDLSTRNGSYKEQLMVRWDPDSSRWMKALRIASVNFQLIDEKFPMAADGRVDWSVFTSSLGRSTVR